MKKNAILILALIAAMLLCACSGGGNETTTTQPTQSQTQPQQQGPAKDPVGYTFTYEGVQFGVGMDGAEVFKALGDPKDRAVTESCAFGGNDIVYDYRSVKISANDEEGYEKIYCIELVDDMAQTEKGIKVGSTDAQVTEAYGEPATTNAGGVIYTKDGMELRILMKDGKVTNIQYMIAGVN